MRLLEKAIREKGKVLPGDVLKVGAFLNHQLDVRLLKKIGNDIYKHFKDCGVTKILTVEASGIGLACLTAQFFDCNVVFAKKGKSSNVDGDVYSAECFSYTHGNRNTLIVPKEFLPSSDRVLFIDDFLAHGEAVRACRELVRQSGATLVGIGIAVEKGFQGAGDELRRDGIDCYSAAIVEKMTPKRITFRHTEEESSEKD